ncbi:hypothetical protein Tco_0345659 [Tanacetum coccineum]
MGAHKLMLLAMVLFCFCSRPSYAQVSKNSLPGNTRVGEGSGMLNQSMYTTTLKGGGTGGHSEGGGGIGNGNGGQSNSSPQEGGNGVVPVYAAGAGGQLRKHKGVASTYTPHGFVVFIATTLTSLLLDVLV